MTAPVVGSSGGVYALVSAHLANVVMVSFVLFFVFVVGFYLCHHSSLVGPHPPAGAALPPNTKHSSPLRPLIVPQRSETCAGMHTCLCDKTRKKILSKLSPVFGVTPKPLLQRSSDRVLALIIYPNNIVEVRKKEFVFLLLAGITLSITVRRQ